MKSRIFPHARSNAFLLLLALLLYPLATPSAAFAQTGCVEYRQIGPAWMQIDVKCQSESVESSSNFNQQHGKSKTVSSGPKLRYNVEYFSECTPDLTVIRSCDAIADPTCPDGGYRTVRTIRAVNGPRIGQVVAMTQYCQIEPPTTIPGVAEDIARVTLADFRRLPILASTIISQPENFSLRNGHANLYAESKNQSFNIVIFDQDVRVRAIPTSYSWSYGDGTSRIMDFPGEPQANRGFDAPTSTSHVYKETGDFSVGLTTRFRGEYSTEGGPWTPIPGIANVPSASVTLSVWRTKKVLVAENCQSTPDGPGCASIFE